MSSSFIYEIFLRGHDPDVTILRFYSSSLYTGGCGRHATLLAKRCFACSFSICPRLGPQKYLREAFFHFGEIGKSHYSDQNGALPWPCFRLSCSQKWARLLCSPPSAYLRSRSAVLSHRSALTIPELSCESGSGYWCAHFSSAFLLVCNASKRN
jgi:hypothetical protein